jgi:long-subunit fatty acid transport protein
MAQSTVLQRQTSGAARRRFPLLVLLLWALLPECAFAQDFFHGGVSAQTLARAGIYTPGPTNALDALALNPAGLSSLAAPVGDAMLFSGLAWGSFSNAANDDSRMRLRPGFTPIGAVATPIGHSRRWSAGLGVTPDFLSAVNWHYSDSPGTGGADYGSQAEQSEISAYRASAGVAFAPSPRLSVGATVGLVYNENTLVAPYIFQENPSLAGLKTLLAMHTRGLGWGGSLGVTARPVRKLEMSAAWSSPIVVNGKGHASGDLGEQFAVLDIPFAPDYIYRARVRVELPQSFFVGGRWQAARNLGLSLQGDWDGFHHAFQSLPVNLSNGNNADINGFLGSSSIQDEVPLNWSDQYTLRVAFDRSLGEHYEMGGGYTRHSSLVPNGTLTPLNAAIMKNGLSTGIEFHDDRIRAAAAYAISLNQSASVGTSGLLAGEYSNSRVTIGTQTLILELALRLK